MKRSLLGVLVASSVIMMGACAGEDEAAETELDTVEEVQQPVAPAPAPMDTMPIDTMAVDTMATTTTGM
jgi:hypothetical protein